VQRARPQRRKIVDAAAAAAARDERGVQAALLLLRAPRQRDPKAGQRLVGDPQCGEDEG
jgi:hypothetical protein